MLTDLKKLKSINVTQTLIDHDLRFTACEPSNDSVFFRVEKISGPPNYFLRAILLLLVACGIAVLNQCLSAIPDDFRNYAIAGTTLGVVVITALVRGYNQSEIVAESILAVPEIGIQLFAETRGGELRNLKTVETDRVDEVLMIEAFAAFKVVEYIAFELVPLGKKPGLLVLPFQHFELPIEWQVIIMRSLRRTLHIHDHPIRRKSPR